MGELKVEYVPTGNLKTYANNAKIHTAEQVEQIKKSIQEFGFNDPIAVWHDNEIIEGHGRLIAATELGIEKVPVIRLDELTDEQRRAYMLVHNKLTMDTGFEFTMLAEELDDITDIDMASFGFDTQEKVESELNDFFAPDIQPVEEEEEEPETYTRIMFIIKPNDVNKNMLLEYLVENGYEYES